MATTWMAIAAIALILTGAIVKIVHEKKKGVKCIGCPAAHACAQNNHTPCDECSHHTQNSQ